MSTTKEFTVLMEDCPDMLGKLCQALADHEVAILALQCLPIREKLATRFVPDNPNTG